MAAPRLRTHVEDSVQVTEDLSLGKGEIFMWALASVLTGGFALL